jgi:hypothetical protein
MPVRILCTIWAHVYSVFESRSALFPTIRVFVFMFLVGCVLSVLRTRISADVEKLTREKELDARDRQAWHQETRGCREPMSAVRKCHAGSIVRARHVHMCTNITAADAPRRVRCTKRRSLKWQARSRSEDTGGSWSSNCFLLFRGHGRVTTYDLPSAYVVFRT